MYIEKEKYKGFEIEIHDDESASSPREWDNMTTMICMHGSLSLGDKHGYGSNDFYGWEGLKERLKKDYDIVSEILPMYMYNHSGITISTTPFSCRWDSGQIGWVFISQNNIDICGKPADMNASIQCEVEEYDKYLGGDCYGYIIDGPSTEDDDSCWGFVGLGVAILYAKQAIDGIISYNAKQSNEEFNKSFRMNTYKGYLDPLVLGGAI